MNSLPTLFSRTQTGAIQAWTITVHENKYQTTFGQIDGKFQTTNWTECCGTNIGRSNERTPQEQAKFEAEALWKKKKDSGYFESINEIDNVNFIEPMLAKSYEDFKDKTRFPVYSQPKLDGIRCIVTKKGMYSRNGKLIVSCPHIQKELEYLFETFPNAVLDGELYCDKLNNDFNKICSLVKKIKPNNQELQESANTIQYHIYDTVQNKTYRDRLLWLVGHIKETNSIKLVETVLCENKASLDRLYEDYVSQGFEGQMIRTDCKYEQKRSKGLLKRKEFQDNEYTILDIIQGEGNKTGIAGAMTFKNERGIQFNSNIKGNREYLKDLWINRHVYIGKQATVKYFNLTPDNEIPRFPYVVGIRDYE
jgi:DNA ligase-1